MASMNEATDQVAGSASAEVLKIAHRFDESWRRGEHPTITSYLEEGGGKTAILLELVYIDLRHRLEAGQPVRVEQYLERFPVLMQDHACLLNLLGAEFQLRKRTDSSVSIEEYIKRFPGFRTELPKALSAPGRLDDTVIILNEKNRGIVPTPETSPAVSAVAETRPSGAEGNGEAQATAAAADQSHAVTAAPQQENTLIEPSVEALASKAQEQAPTLFHSESEVGTSPPVAPRTNVPGFEILGELGRGGMGVVYKARQIGLNRLVALKMILSGQHAGQKDLIRFKAEAEVIARLRNPNIVQIYDFNTHEGFPYFALEYIDGGTLSHKLAGKPMEPRAAAELMRQAASAVHAAHKEGIIHRDLKPDNILLTSDGIPKLTDFGLAKHLGTSSVQTQTGTVMGTPGYMAPEQAMGKTKGVGPAADIYSLGAIFFEMLTGRPPFRGETPVDTMLLVVSQEPTPPSRIVPSVPKDLETICLKCLQKDIDHRYQTAQEFADELGRYLSGEPILARPISGAQRVVRWCRRNSKSVVVGTLVAAVFLVLTGALVYKMNTPPPTQMRVVTNIGGQLVEVPEEPEAKRDRSMEILVAEGNKFDEDLDPQKLEAIRKSLAEVEAQKDPPPGPESVAYLKVLKTLVDVRSDDATVRAEALGQLKGLLGQPDVKRPDRLCQAVAHLAQATPPALSASEAVGILHQALARDNFAEAAKARIRDYLRALQTRQVRIDVVARKASWQDLLAACNEADPNDGWVKAARAEALLEMAGGRPTPQVLNDAGAALSSAALKEAGDYGSYVEALWFDASDKSVEAANELLPVLQKSPLEEALRVVERQKRALAILLKSVDKRKVAPDPANPFLPPFAKESLPAVFAVLKTARDLTDQAKVPPDNGLLSNLALAAWHKDPRDAKLAGELLPLLKTDTLKPEEALPLKLLKIQAYQDDPGHRKDALIGYAQLLSDVRDFLKAKDVSWSPSDWYKNIVEPGVAVGEKLQVTDKSPYEERQAMARLFIEKGMLLGQDSTLVPSASNPYAQMKEANEKALQLDDKLPPFDKATCILQRDLALMWLGKQDLNQFAADAAQMQQLDPKYPGSHYLLGYVRSAEAREAARKRDWDAARSKREEANKEYTQAIELLRKKDPYKELPAYYMERCNNWYEWSYLDPNKRVDYLSEAIKDARAAIALKPLHVDYANAFLGNALEDLAWFTGKPEHYAQAVFQFNEARQKDPKKSKYWIDLARCKFRTLTNTPRSDPIFKKYLNDGIGHLQTILNDEKKGERKLEPREKAEASFWLAKLFVVENKLTDAEKAFDAVAALQGQPDTANWIAMALEESADALLKQAAAVEDNTSADFKKHVSKAREKAQALASQPGKARTAGRLLGLAAQLENNPTAALDEYQKAIAKEPLRADEASMRLGSEKLNLLLAERWKADLRGKNVPGTDAESVAAQADALAALSDQVPIFRGGVYGLAGLAHIEAANPDDAKQLQAQRQAAVEKLRVAVAETPPGAVDGWRWRFELAKVLRDLAKADSNKAYKDEALKVLGEAEKYVPGDRKIELQTLKKELQS